MPASSLPVPQVSQSAPTGTGAEHRTGLRPATALASRAALAALIAWAGVAAPLNAQDDPDPQAVEEPVILDSWTVPWPDARPTSIAATSSGIVWFVEEGQDHLGVLEPDEGEIHRFILPEGTGPTSLDIGPGGFPWFAAGASGILGRLDPESGEVLRYDLPDPLAFAGRLAAGPDGMLWFTAADGEGSGFLGRMNPVDGEMAARGFDEPLSESTGLAVDPDGGPWVGLAESGVLVRLDPATMVEERIELPEGPRSPLVGGGVFWLDRERGAVVRLDPSTGGTEDWPVAADWAPAHLVGSRGGSGTPVESLVLVSGEAPLVARTFDPVSGALGEPVELPLEDGIITALHLDGQTGTLWVGTDRGELARVTIGSEPTP